MYVAAAYTHIATSVLMTAVLLTIIIRFRSCHFERHFLLVLWLYPISYYILSIADIFFLIDHQKYNILVHYISSATLPISLMLIRCSILLFAFEMLKMRLKISYD